MPTVGWIDSLRVVIYPNDHRPEHVRFVGDRLAKTPIATAAHYDRRLGHLVIDLSSGLSLSFKPQVAEGLEHAKAEQLTTIEISPSGLGLHFPAIDADIYLPSLVEGFLGSRRWMAAQLGKVGGRAVSPAKANTVRANGKLRGRPKKQPVLPALRTP